MLLYTACQVSYALRCSLHQIWVYRILTHKLPVCHSDKRYAGFTCFVFGGIQVHVAAALIPSMASISSGTFKAGDLEMEKAIIDKATQPAAQHFFESMPDAMVSRASQAFTCNLCGLVVDLQLMAGTYSMSLFRSLLPHIAVTCSALLLTL